MPILRTDFTAGKMNLDSDERLLPKGEFRRAENILIANSEGSNVGSIQKSYSNKQLTNLNFGSDPLCLLGYEDEFNKKIYYFILSSLGCYLVEWDDINQVSSIVLEDTRAIGSRVLDLKANHLITGIGKIITGDINKDLLIWTDDNIEPCCINIERAKTYGPNNFTKEDIYLIKKPPLYAPTLLPINIAGLANNMAERFLCFTYRYKYLDGEYSALSTYTNYSFIPEKFNLNYYTLDNEGMVNAFNAVKISFNTGEKQVTDIQLVVKESNSNNLYIIETFNKYNEGWGDNQTQDFTFSNNKIYQILPEKELYRAFDNVPLKSKSLTIIDNTIVFGDYVEGRNIEDANGVKIKPNYDLSLINDPIDVNNQFPQELPNPNQLSIVNPSIPLLQGNKLDFYIHLMIDGTTAYDNDFYYILPQNFASLDDIFSSTDFQDFLAIIDADIKANYIYTIPAHWVSTIEPTFTYSLVSGASVFTISPITFTDTLDNTTHIVNFEYFSSSNISITSSSNSTSLKTNRDYEVGLEYEDDYCRKTTVLTDPYNSIYVPQQYSTFKNRIKVTLNSKAPHWAKRYRFVVKSQPLEYQTIYVNKFYNDDNNFYVWCKLEAENKDKVKVGDFIIVKKGPNPITNVIKVKVLEIKEQPKDFISGNYDNDGNAIIEEEGFYMKIRPEGFSMSYTDYTIKQSDFPDVGSEDYPVGYLDLFTENVGGVNTELAIPIGSSIYLYMNSSRYTHAVGWINDTYEVTHYSQRNYTTIEDWFIDNIINKNLFVTNNDNEVKNYKPNIALVRGYLTPVGGGINVFNPNPTGKLYLQITGLETGANADRKGYVRAKIVVRTNTGFYVFETEPKIADQNIYYQSGLTLDIDEDGNHLGNIQDQDVSTNTPAIVDLDFFNCYTQGNGIESYKIRDGFNTNYLNVDLRPSTTLIEEYKEVHCFANMTYGQPYVVSTKLNGLNEFNLSTINFKELDKQFGSIQKLLSKDNNILVFQENKVSRILFNKTALFKSDGTADITTSNNVLGDEIPYMGENGIGKNPESVAVNDYQVYFANPRRGIMQRLSIEGIDEIIYGMINYFRETFIEKPTAKKIGGYDPYHRQFLISIGEEPTRLYNVSCGNILNKLNQTIPFTYTLELNDMLGDIILNYNITSNNATITANYNSTDYVASNVSGVGNITIHRSDLSITTVLVTITPISLPISYEISNSCPVGINQYLVSIILNDDLDNGKTMTNRFRWDSTPFYSTQDTFTPAPLTKFYLESGIEGVGKFPLRGSIVNIQTLKDTHNTGIFDTDKCNRIGYLITPVLYGGSDMSTILSLATFISLSNIGNVTEGNFLFNKSSDNDILYLIWDYTDRKPLLVDDTVSVLPTDTSVTINVLGNDTIFDSSFVITIPIPPTNGTVVVNSDNTITYTPSGDSMVPDEFTYYCGSEDCVSRAKVKITVFEGFLFQNLVVEGGSTELATFDIVTSDGSTRDFNYQIDLVRDGNTKPNTKLTMTSSTISDIVLAPTHDVDVTHTGIFTVAGSRSVTLELLKVILNPSNPSLASGSFKEVGGSDSIDLSY